MKDIDRKYWSVAEKFTAQTIKDDRVIGVLICGSLIHSALSKNSDIDIVIILDKSCDFRERGNTWIDNIEVEYFKNPPQQIRSYFKKEIKSPHTANMLATGKLVYGDASVVLELIEEAKTIIKKGPSEIKPVELKLAQYFIDDKIKDLEDVINEENPIAKTLLKFDILNYAIDTFCKINRVWRAKDKDLKNQLIALDKNFADLIQNEINKKWDQNSVKDLRIKLGQLTQGERPKEWTLKSDLDL